MSQLVLFLFFCINLLRLFGFQESFLAPLLYSFVCKEDFPAAMFVFVSCVCVWYIQNEMLVIFS